MNQNDTVLNHMIDHGGITSMEAFKYYGITRLSARIKDLRDKGYKISSITIHGQSGANKNHYSKYVLRGEQDGTVHDI